MDTLKQTYFDDVYRANEDPWSYETSDYEREKYADTMRSLGRNNPNSAETIAIRLLARRRSDPCRPGRSSAA